MFVIINLMMMMNWIVLLAAMPECDLRANEAIMQLSFLSFELLFPSDIYRLRQALRIGLL
jgi:hypothetical protein